MPKRTAESDSESTYRTVSDKDDFTYGPYKTTPKKKRAKRPPKPPRNSGAVQVQAPRRGLRQRKPPSRVTPSPTRSRGRSTSNPRATTVIKIGFTTPASPSIIELSSDESENVTRSRSPSSRSRSPSSNNDTNGRGTQSPEEERSRSRSRSTSGGSQSREPRRRPRSRGRKSRQADRKDETDSSSDRRDSNVKGSEKRMTRRSRGQSGKRPSHHNNRSLSEGITHSRSGADDEEMAPEEPGEPQDALSDGLDAFANMSFDEYHVPPHETEPQNHDGPPAHHHTSDIVEHPSLDSESKRPVPPPEEGYLTSLTQHSSQGHTVQSGDSPSNQPHLSDESLIVPHTAQVMTPHFGGPASLQHTNEEGIPPIPEKHISARRPEVQTETRISDSSGQENPPLQGQNKKQNSAAESTPNLQQDTPRNSTGRNDEQSDQQVKEVVEADPQEQLQQTNHVPSPHQELPQDVARIQTEYALHEHVHFKWPQNTRGTIDTALMPAENAQRSAVPPTADDVVPVDVSHDYDECQTVHIFCDINLGPDADGFYRGVEKVVQEAPPSAATSLFDTENLERQAALLDMSYSIGRTSKGVPQRRRNTHPMERLVRGEEFESENSMEVSEAERHEEAQQVRRNAEQNPQQVEETVEAAPQNQPSIPQDPPQVARSIDELFEKDDITDFSNITRFQTEEEEAGTERRPERHASVSVGNNSMFETNDVPNGPRTPFPQNDDAGSETRPENLSQQELSRDCPLPVKNSHRQRLSARRPNPPSAPPLRSSDQKDFFTVVGGRTGNIGQFNINTYGNSTVTFAAFGDPPRLPKREPPEVVTLSSEEDAEENPPPRKRKPGGGDPPRSRSEVEKGRPPRGRLSAGGDTRPPSFEGRVYDHAVEEQKETGNMFHTDDVSEQLSRLLLENVTKEHRKFLNKVIWDLEQRTLDQRDDHNLLPVKDAVVHLKGLIVQKKAEGVTPKQLLEQSVWIHKVLHKYFFAPEIDGYVMRAYIEHHFAVGHESVTVDDFYLDNDNLVHYMIAPSEKSNQYVSIVKFLVNSENFLEAVTHDDLYNSLASKYGIKSNGVLCQLRITLLVNVIHETKPSQGSAVTHQQSRNALVEELSHHSKQHKAFASQAKTDAENISDALTQKLTGVDLSAHVVVYHEGKPLTQVDLFDAESLELWRLPEEAKLESDRMSNVNVFKLDDEKEKRFCRLFVWENVELPIRETDKWKESIPAKITNHIDNACGAVNVTMRNFKKMLFVANHVLIYVSFPKMPIEFTRDNLDVTEVEVVFAKVCSGGSQLIKHRVIFRDETGVTPEFGVYEENKRQITPLRLSHQLYGKSLQVHGRIMKIDKKRVTTRANGTTYVYDLPSLFGRACLDEWKKYFDNMENSDDADNLAQFQSVFTTLSKQQQAAYTSGDYRQFFTEIELVLNDGVLIEVDGKEEPKRPADTCNNETGVVAWKLRLFTPEKPKGFDVVVIANDTTFQSGSFATQEDEIYQLASEYSRQRRIPRANVSCNSGARIGLTEDVSKIFTNPENPLEGFDYIYVDGDDEALIKGQLCYEKLSNVTLKLTGVLGRKNEQIGMENLQGSGLIDGETSAAYNEASTY